MHEEMIHRASPWYIDGLTAILRSPLSMQSSSTYTKSIRIPVSELGKNPTSPPAVVLCGITQGYKFTLNSDKAHYKKAIDDDYAGGDLNMHFHWTKSTTNSDQSGKAAKWQMDYLVFNGVDENCNSGETSVSVEDVYESAVPGHQVVHKTGNVTIPSNNFEVHDMISMRIMAVTPSGTPLDDDPVLTHCGISYLARHIT